MPSRQSDSESDDDDYGPAPIGSLNEKKEKSSHPSKRKGNHQEETPTNNNENEKQQSRPSQSLPKKARTDSPKKSRLPPPPLTDPYETLYLQQLPSAQYYETSYMHRDIVTHIVISKTSEFIITGSIDGHVKFWKKMLKTIEFVKHYQAHLGAISDMILSPDGKQLLTISSIDCMIKFFEVISFDMINMIELSSSSSYLPKKGLWIFNEKTHLYDRVAITDGNSGKIIILKATDASGEILQEMSIHSFPVMSLVSHPMTHTVVSVDSRGMIEYWNPSTFQLPSKNNGEITFSYKSETDLFELMKVKTMPISITFAHSGQYFAILSLDKQIRIFHYSSGKIWRQLNESLTVYNQLLQELNNPPPPPEAAAAVEVDSDDDGSDSDDREGAGPKQAKQRKEEVEEEDQKEEEKEEKEEKKKQEETKPKYILPKLDGLDLGRRIALEKELESNIDSLLLSNVVFDASDHFIIYSSLRGIKIINLLTQELVRVIGQGEKTERFLKIALYQGIPVVDQQLLLSRQSALASSSNGNTAANKQTTIDIQQKTTEDILAEASQPDPTLFVTSFKKRRFYCFSSREPSTTSSSSSNAESTIETRDKFNELPTEEEKLSATQLHNLIIKQLPTEAILHTTYGDIFIKLFANECPKTVENFTTHIENGYYNNIIFHRVIKNFMIQTGDPLGDGTGGESIWGKEFEDEFVRTLRHDRPFTVSMANAGFNTNGSQFFITTVPAPWLDNKHTVFGRVVKGFDVVTKIENVKVNKIDKPYETIRILSAEVRNE